MIQDRHVLLSHFKMEGLLRHNLYAKVSSLTHRCVEGDLNDCPTSVGHCHPNSSNPSIIARRSS